jgi:hypothetical protein
VPLPSLAVRSKSVRKVGDPIGLWGGLRVPLYQKIDASAQPLEIGARGHTVEGRAVELACRGLRKGGGRLLRPLDTAAARDDLVEPQHVARQAAFAPPRQEAADPRSVCAFGVTQRVRERKGPYRDTGWLEDWFLEGNAIFSNGITERLLQPRSSPSEGRAT